MIKKKLILFDVDETLTKSRCFVKDNMVNVLTKISKLENVTIGFVGGSNLDKQHEQLGEYMNLFTYWFPENGLVAYKNSEIFYSADLMSFFTDNSLKKFINFSLHYIADLDIPIKKGTFFEYRTGLINICPVGRDCSQAVRNDFEKYDKEYKIRENMISKLKEEFNDLDLHYCIGGQISFDVFPKGWDKTFCLRHVKDEEFEEIYFFGDKTYLGGNDYEIYNHPDVIGVSVTCPDDTVKFLEEKFL